MTVDWAKLRTIAGRSAVAVAALQTVTATLGQRAGRRDYADAAWGPGLAGIALISAVTGTGDASRRWGAAALTGAWAVRLERLMAGRLLVSAPVQLAAASTVPRSARRWSDPTCSTRACGA